MCEQDVPRKMTRKKVTILMDSFAQCLNMKQEEKKKNMPDHRPTQTTAAIHITVHREHRIALTHTDMKHTNTAIPLLTQS